MTLAATPLLGVGSVEAKPMQGLPLAAERELSVFVTQNRAYLLEADGFHELLDEGGTRFVAWDNLDKPT